MRNFLYLLLCIIIFTGCAGAPPQTLDPKVYYKRDMKLKVNGYQGEGTLVVPKKDIYKFDITAKGRLDLFVLNSCHREIVKEAAGSKGIFNGPRRAKFDFKPVPLEMDGTACPLVLTGLEAKKGRHSWGMVIMEHESLQLNALLSCNGSQENTHGVSLCQAKTGLIQEITFPEKVLVALEDVCIQMKSEDEKTFRFKMPNRECSFRFVTKSGTEKWHLLMTIGYEQILIRRD